MKPQRQGKTGNSQVQKKDGEKPFKQPKGSHPDRISLEYTPLMPQNWAADKRLYIKTCSNLEILSTDKQRTLCKKFVNPAL